MDGSFWEKIDRFKLPLALSLLGIVLIIAGIFASGLNKPKAVKNPSNFPKESLVESQKTISVDVSGAVKTPGVYQLDSNARVENAIKAAGGFTENVNTEFVSKYLNMAQKLSDGSKVYLPFEGEQAPAAQSTVAGTSAQAQVNINTASQAELEALPGIGPATASKIISARTYQSIQELLDKKIVSKAVLEKIRDQLTIY